MLRRTFVQAIRRTTATATASSSVLTSSRYAVRPSTTYLSSYRIASTTSDQNKKQIPIPEQPDVSPDKTHEPLAEAAASGGNQPATVRQGETSKAGKEAAPAEDAHTLMSEQEKEILSKLLDNFPGGAVSVQDVSGGCGTFFAIQIESDKFEGMSKIKQHQHVNKILKDEVATWHGMQLKTMTP